MQVRSLAVAVSLLLVPVSSGCRSSEAVPQLLNVMDVGPRIVSRGDTLEIAGSGFPSKRTARVTLIGTIFRPGREPLNDVMIDVDGTAATPSKIELSVSDALLEAACGKGDAALHATFRGAVEVSFPAITPGALPITGTVHDVTIDLRAPVRRSATAAQADEGSRVLALVGIKPAADLPATGGVAVAEVEKDGAADQAGIAPGDVLATCDGWTVLDPGDVVPSGRNRFTTLGVRRGDAPIAERAVALRGYRPRGSTDLLGVALVLGTAAAAIVFFASPFGRGLTWLERWTGRSGPRRGRDAVAWMATSAHALLGGTGDPLAELWPTLAVLGTSALVAVAPFARSLLGIGPDVGTGFVLATMLAVALALTSGRAKTSKSWSFVASLRLAGWTLAHHLPALGAVACAVALTGSLSMSDLVAAQGGEPWHWLAVRSPAGPLMLALTMWPVLLEIRGPRTALPDAITDAPRSDDGAVLPPAAWAATLLLSSVASAAWLGGWSLPFVDTAAQARSFPLTALGATFFLAKTWALALAMATLRAVLPRPRIEQTGRPLVTIGGPAALVGMALTAGWIAWDPAPIVRRGVAAVLCGLSLLLVIHALRRLAGATRGAAQAQVSPFLLVAAVDRGAGVRRLVAMVALRAVVRR